MALDDIAERTKIKRSLLEGLERDDPDTLVREFLEIHPDPVEEIAKVAAIQRRQLAAESRHQNALQVERLEGPGIRDPGIPDPGSRPRYFVSA